MLTSVAFTLVCFVILQVGSACYNMAVGELFLAPGFPFRSRLCLEWLTRVDQARVVLATAVLALRLYVKPFTRHGRIPPVAELALSLGIAALLLPLGLGFDAHEAIAGLLGLVRVDDVQAPLFLMLSAWEIAFITVAAWMIVNGAARRDVSKLLYVVVSSCVVECVLLLMALSRTYVFRHYYEAIPQAGGVVVLGCLYVFWRKRWPRREALMKTEAREKAPLNDEE